MPERSWCALVLLVLLAVLATGVVEAQPRPAPESLLQERADGAVAIHDATTSLQRKAVAAAVIMFVLTALALGMVSSRWIGPAWLQWLVLLAVPVGVALLVVWLSAGGIHAALDDLPDSSLRQIPDHPALGANHDLVAAAREALALKGADARGHLWWTLAFTPAALSLASALVLSVVLWFWTNKRVVRAA